MEKLEISQRKRKMVMKKNVINWEKDLPHHIFELIVSKLVISNLPIARLVSKTWNAAILDYASSSKLLTNAFLLCTNNPKNCNLLPSYPKLHCINITDIPKLNHSNLDDAASLSFDFCEWSSIVNICNGLLYISKSDSFSNCAGIFNPMTNEFLNVPLNFNHLYHYGFGFSPTTKQYKLFRVNYTIVEVLIFTHNHNLWNWRRLPHRLPFDADKFNHGAYLNGVIYWIGKEKDVENDQLVVIYALDIETETFKLSGVLEVGCCSRVLIQQFNDGVYAVFCNKTTHVIQVWRMQEKDSWIREFVIDQISKYWSMPPNYFMLIKAFEDGEILCRINRGFFCLYNPITRREKMIKENQNILIQICQINSLNFGSLANILAGDEKEQTSR